MSVNYAQMSAKQSFEGNQQYACLGLYQFYAIYTYF